MNFLSSLLSKKLGFAAAVEAFVYTLPMSADWKGVCMSGIAVVYIACLAWIESRTEQARPAELIVTIPPPRGDQQ